jgi:hypothetical protein
MTASSDSAPAFTFVRISWPRLSRATTTISPGYRLAGRVASSTWIVRFSKSIITR